MAKKRESGFTLIELTIAIAILAILAAIAVPNVIGWLPNHRLKSAARDLVSNFQRAKLEAVKRNRDVVIGFNTGAYTPGGQVGRYEVFVDNGAGGGVAGNFTRDGNETRILLPVTMPKNVSLYLANFSGNTTTGFDSRGLALASRSGSVEMRNNNSRFARVTLSIAGCLRLQTSNDGINWFNWD
jgi:type IV fimbrial biogenesis protein FimT